MPCCALSATSLVTWVDDDHAVGDRQRARGLRLREAATVAGVRDVDQALAARADRREQRVVAEARDLDADLLGGADHQGVLGDLDDDAVDGQRDGLDGRRRGVRLGRGRHASHQLVGEERSTSSGRTGSRRGAGARGTPRGSTRSSSRSGSPRRRPARRTSGPGCCRTGRAAGRGRTPALAALERGQRLHQPPGALAARACTCRRTRACRTRSSAAPRGPRRWSRRRAGARGCRASSRPRRPPRSRGVRRGARRSAAGCWSRPGVQNFSSWPSRMPPARSISSRSVMPSGASY